MSRVPKQHLTEVRSVAARWCSVAASSVEWTMQRDFYVLLTDAPGDNAYPTMATSFGLLRKYPKNPERTREAIAFFRWALEKGQDLACTLNYLPLPTLLVRQGRRSISRTAFGSSRP